MHRCPAARRQPCWPRSQQTRLSNGPARPFPRRLPLCTRSTSIDAGPLEDAGAIAQVVATELPHFVCEVSRSLNQATQIVIGRAQWSGRSLGYEIVRANNAALQRVYYLRTSVFLRSCRICSLRLAVPLTATEAASGPARAAPPQPACPSNVAKRHVSAPTLATRRHEPGPTAERRQRPFGRPPPGQVQQVCERLQVPGRCESICVFVRLLKRRAYDRRSAASRQSGVRHHVRQKLRDNSLCNHVPPEGTRRPYTFTTKRRAEAHSSSSVVQVKGNVLVRGHSHKSIRLLTIMAPMSIGWGSPADRQAAVKALSAETQGQGFATVQTEGSVGTTG